MPNPENWKPLFCLRLPPEVIRAIKEEADSQNVWYSDIVRQAIQEYFRRRGKYVNPWR